MPQPFKVAELYAKLEIRRDNFLVTARRCAQLTIPFLVPPEGHTSSSIYPTPFQGVGARGVNNLASKLLLALLPPNSPFFRLVVDRYELKKIENNVKLKTALEAALGEVERAVGDEVETSAVRISVFELLKHLIVAGNGLLYVPKKGGIRVYHLDRFVVRRDPMGHVKTIIVKEDICREDIPPTILKRIGGTPEGSSEKTQALYTCIHRSRLDQHWKVWQEVGGFVVPDSEGTYPKDRCPWVALRYSKIDGEDYGRGLVEEILGELSTLEGLQQTMGEGSAAAAKLLFMVSPTGTTRVKAIAEAPNGAIIQGNKDDVTVLQVDKFYDFRTVQAEIARLEKNLELAFLLTAGATRQAERVTAEEIRAMVQELEGTLGGVYSVLGQELQLPLVNALMDRMSADGRLPKIPKGIVKPTIVTGLDALGRGNDLQKLDSFVAGLQQLFGPQQVGRYVNISDYLERRATSLGIDTEGLIKTPEEIAAEDQQAQQAALTQQVAPEGVRQFGQMLQNNQKANLAPQQ